MEDAVSGVAGRLIVVSAEWHQHKPFTKADARDVILRPVSFSKEGSGDITSSQVIRLALPKLAIERASRGAI